MNRLIATLCIFSMVTLLSACAEAPVDTGPTAAEQRAHAEKAQGELSSETRK